MKIGILDIGTNKISCFIVNIVKDKEPIILGIGHHQSNGISSGTIIDMGLACNSIRSSIQSAEKIWQPICHARFWVKYDFLRKLAAFKWP